MSSKELEARLECMKRDMAAIEAEIRASKEGLKPYEWCEVERYHVDQTGRIHRNNPSGRAPSLFYKATVDEAKRFAHKLKILSCINNLKKTLGCNWEFTEDTPNYTTQYSVHKNVWKSTHFYSLDSSLIYFENKEDAEKVAKYLNKHYPNGWSLPASTSESD